MTEYTKNLHIKSDNLVPAFVAVLFMFLGIAIKLPVLLLAVLLLGLIYFSFFNVNPLIPLSVGFIALLPLRIPVEFFGINLELYHLFLVSVFTTASSFIAGMVHKKKITLSLPFFWLLLVWLVLVTVQLPRAIDVRVTSYNLKNTSLMMLFFYLCFNIIKAKDLKKILFYFVLVSAPIALIGIAQHIFKFFFVENCNLPEFRAMGTLYHPNDFAMYLMLVIVLGVALVIDYGKKRISYYLSALVVLDFIALIMTYSRSMWICLFVSVFVLLFFINKKYILILFGVFLAALVVMPGTSREKFLKPVNLSDNSHVARVNMVKNAWNMIKTAPVFGVGDANSYYLYDKYAEFESFGSKKIHTQIITLTAEYGLFGLAFFVLLLAAFTMKMLEKIKSAKKHDKIFKTAFFSLCIALFLNAQFNGSFLYEPYVWLVFSLALL